MTRVTPFVHFPYIGLSNNVELGHTDTDFTTCLSVPSIGLVVAGDAAYNDVHLYLVGDPPP